MCSGNYQHVSVFRYFYEPYQQSFFPSTIILWNQLPQTVVSKTSLEAFQIQLANIIFFNLLTILTAVNTSLIRGLWTFSNIWENTQVLSYWSEDFVDLCWGFTALSTQWGHVECGKFT